MRRIRRRARLFVAGDYPDKGVSFTEQDIETIVQRFTGPVQINLHHLHTGLSETFGLVKRIWRRGVELFGELEFPESVWQWMQEAGARFLSVELQRTGDDGWNLTGLALTDDPRVASAQVFEHGVRLPGVVESVSMAWGGLSMDDVLQQIYDALNPDRDLPVWVEDLFEDSVVISDDGRYWMFSLAVEDGRVILGDRVAVRRTWTPVNENEPAQMENEPMADEKTITMTAEDLQSVVQEAVRAALAAEETRREEERRAADAARAEAEAHLAAERLKNEGRIGPGQVEPAARLISADEEAFRAFLEARPRQDDGPAMSDVERAIFQALQVRPEYVERVRAN